MREYGKIYYSSMVGLLNALTEAGYPISTHDLSDKDNIKSSYGDDGVILTHASEEALCLTLYCALGLLIEKGISVNLSKSNAAEYLLHFPAVKIEIRPNRENNTIVRKEKMITLLMKRIL